MARAYLGLGSNLGDRKKELDFALDSLKNHPDINLVQIADILETDPVGYLEQGKFLNTVVELETTLEPYALLSVLQQIEQDAGRVRTIRWGPRTLDIDILLYDNLTLQDPDLIIPHPRMREREFVLLPLLQIAPNLFVPPNSQTVKELYEQYRQSRCTDAAHD
ncbi:MAG: 2-amino-4-hydroxy-6-hydroxymethyldihydropteridine diphosphokinase [Clostridiales bacterium]|jgi:2-amino-4-hydroxy-6-hydroxymethyldihydropteridine diphosphokinase|nr:2-amino-4-hydroxy-6-hydroxymethyldihydropteridine diphosphokinase [Clostridiales bacterium]